MLPLDYFLFLLINHLPHNAASDGVAMLLSGVGQWGAVWFFLAVVLFFREEKKDHWFFAPFFLSAAVSALLSDWLLKMLFARPRPTAEMDAIIVSAADNYSFPSTHATVAFALAYVLAKEEPRWALWLYVLAAFISASRIYLGVHYPVDVLAGMLLGLGVGKISIYISRRFRRMAKKK